MNNNISGKRILVIEDEKKMAELISSFLAKEGCLMDVTHDGLEGLRKIKEINPDLIILDIILPKLDGRDLLKAVKEDGEIKGIPVLVVSARSAQWDRDIGLSLGATEYIEKPIEFIQLVRKVRNILSVFTG